MTHWVIFDLDGTLANIQHRLHHIKHEEYLETLPKHLEQGDGYVLNDPIPTEEFFRKNVMSWDKFNDGIKYDSPKWNIIYLLKAMKDRGEKIALVTGRFEKYKQETLDWLQLHNVEFDEIHFRKDGDYRSDHQVKQQIYIEEFLDKHKDILFVVDDRDQVVEMWRRNGLTCLQCQKGDY